ncbi:hypothetical protein LAZ67_7000504 [Cordylochernes scorpioides]|uniref:Transposase n=1 Tax=Cordylochernes scorpioides TaxID=51811 RepID=A0ABY6KLL2_9ARAC|nr:hypothetical protein LAZ67_7000504 [Cordylochernes scorpioides]
MPGHRKTEAVQADRRFYEGHGDRTEKGRFGPYVKSQLIHTLVRPRNAGATRVTSARVDRRILRQAVAAPQATCTAILQHVQDTLDHSISTRTISRRLVANGLHSCRPLRRLPLTPPNRRQRLECCRARSTWMTEWHRVVFSDESRFCLPSDSRRVRVWRRRGERSKPAAIGTMTAQRYVDDVLRPVTLPYLQGVPNAFYQQDNARPHTARISQQALQDVQMLPWPPYSPDLSPIEHVWDIIGRRLHALPQPRSEDELWQMVEREWRAIPQDAIRTLIDSLPRRVAACIAVRAEWFDLLRSTTNAIRTQDINISKKHSKKFEFWSKKYAFPDVKKQTSIVNLSSFPISQSQEELLNQGLIYRMPRHADPYVTTSGIEVAMTSFNNSQKNSIRNLVSSKITNQKRPYAATPRKYATAIKELKANHNIVISKADKGSNVILNKVDYRKKILDIVEDKTPLYLSRLQTTFNPSRISKKHLPLSRIIR